MKIKSTIFKQPNASSLSKNSQRVYANTVQVYKRSATWQEINKAGVIIENPVWKVKLYIM